MKGKNLIIAATNNVHEIYRGVDERFVILFCEILFPQVKNKTLPFSSVKSLCLPIKSSRSPTLKCPCIFLSLPAVKPLVKKINRFARILRVLTVRKFIHVSRKIHFPGFEGLSLWETMFFFFYSVRKGFIGTRASALAFHFFLAMIPFGLVMVVLSDSLRFFDLEHDVIPILASFIPKELFDHFMENVTQFHNSTVSSIASVGFLVALYFTSNGFSVMIRSFNHSQMKFQKRQWLSIRITSFLLVLAFVVGILVLFLTMVYSRKMLNSWGAESEFINDYQQGIFLAIAVVIATAALYFGIALLYTFGPSKRKTFRFFSAGATLATLMIILISKGYTLYIQHLARFDELYGSVGTIMILMLWIYLMSFALLIGFELNASIHGAIRRKRLNNFNEMEERYDETTG